MNTQPLSIADVVGDAEWLADRYDPGHDAIHFRKVTRAQHDKAVFLTDEYLGASDAPVVVRRSDVIAAKPRTVPIHYIFHSAYCCSTLLARAFDINGVSMGLKEPVILNDLVGWRLRGGDPKAIGAALDTALSVMARPFGGDRAVIVKPSNVCNGLAEAMMALRPDANAVLLHAPLPIFLGSIAKKGMWGRLWVRELMIKQLKEGFVDLGFSDEDYLGLTDLQAAAVGWLAQQALFMRMAARFGQTRVATLDSEMLLSAPAETIARLSAHFALALDGDRVAAIVAGPAFTRHSKIDGTFDAQARVDEQQNAAGIHSEEIQKVSAWAAVIAENNAIAMHLPVPLLG